MTERVLTISLNPNWQGALRGAAQKAIRGLDQNAYQGEQLNFETPGALFGRLTERRWALVRALQSQGPAGVRELSRRLDRDVKRVHEDARVLRDLGMIEQDDAGRYRCPFVDIHVDMHLLAADVPAGGADRDDMASKA